ncbi:MAG: hypothetical protein GY696_05495 [Gammaproteobacteria bacterium]|nr:hypothetical protein [Gammaproteobacteria bacterium]
MTNTLTILKSESEWALAMLREKRAKDQENQQKEEALRAQEPVTTVSGGQQRSMYQPPRVDTGYQTMSADQLEDRGARWGHISLRQIAVSKRARGPPVVTLHSVPDPEIIRQRDLFLSYEQGADQALNHYLNVNWGLFEQGWPDPTRRSIAFGIEDTVNGIQNRAVRNGLDKECMATPSDLRVRAVQLVKTERTHMIYDQSTNRSWQGLELQGDAWLPRPITP